MTQRTITTKDQLIALRHGSAVLTSDSSDTVVLRSTRVQNSSGFINADGGEVDPESLWVYGTKPFTVLWEPNQ